MHKINLRLFIKDGNQRILAGFGTDLSPPFAALPKSRSDAYGDYFIDLRGVHRQPMASPITHPERRPCILSVTIPRCGIRLSRNRHRQTSVICTSDSMPGKEDTNRSAKPANIRGCGSPTQWRRMLKNRWTRSGVKMRLPAHAIRQTARRLRVLVGSPALKRSGLI